MARSTRRELLRSQVLKPHDCKKTFSVSAPSDTDLMLTLVQDFARLVSSLSQKFTDGPLGTLFTTIPPHSIVFCAVPLTNALSFSKLPRILSHQSAHSTPPSAM